MDFKVVLVKWIDARCLDEMMYLEEVKDFRPCLVYSVGAVVEVEGGLCLVQDYFPRDLLIDKEETYRHVEVIPKQAILEVVEVGKITVPIEETPK